ncbi:L-rhamnose mutarotase [Hephaestia sp. GCM10023244]|uniref:L-rhamnose mutarotase n=1 Tax=unclassified Hephaestia TaxID=2631281 RepID=UPI002077827B|nr:L-rhamnose mutarotase [Hephaestia sp. MAHUQ-44]MCM8730550.1 L-rhamnose mutarotase [Hephaestia sp. MAHUQ-44]
MSEKVAFRMRLRPGCLEAYRQRHDAVWPDLSAALKAAGVRDYSIHHDPETDALFATMWRDDAARVAALADSDVMRRWWASMAPLMVTNPDLSPETVPLDTVFHLD